MCGRITQASGPLRLSIVEVSMSGTAAMRIFGRAITARRVGAFGTSEL